MAAIESSAVDLIGALVSMFCTRVFSEVVVRSRISSPPNMLLRAASKRQLDRWNA
jgi:hypothetical protein